MIEIPWVRGGRTPDFDKFDWREGIKQTFTNNYTDRFITDSTKATEECFELEPSLYWYISTCDTDFSHATMIWFLDKEIPSGLTSDICGVCQCDSGGIFHEYNLAIKGKGFTEKEKIEFFKENDITLEDYNNKFLDMLQKIGIDNYACSTKPNAKDLKWEGRISDKIIRNVISLNKIYLTYDDKQFFIDFIRGSNLSEIKQNSIIYELNSIYSEVDSKSSAYLQVKEEIKEILKHAT